MIKSNHMEEQAQKYCLGFVLDDKEVYLCKHQSDVKLTTKRAIDWVNAGITDLDCRSKEKMLEILNSWL